MFWTLHLIGWLPLHCLVLFLEFRSVLPFGSYFFVSVCLLHRKWQSLRYSPGWGNPGCCIVVLYVGEGSEREQGHLFCSPILSVTSSTTHKQVGPSGADSQVDRFVYALGPCASLQWNLLWGWEFLLPCQSPQLFFQSEVLRLYFPLLEPWVAWSVSLLSCSSWFICTQMWDCPVLQLMPCHESSLAWLPISTPPTGLDECFFFNSLIVGLPYNLIFWQFWLFFVFKFVVVLWLCEEAKCIHLCLHLGQKSEHTRFRDLCVCLPLFSPCASNSYPSTDLCFRCFYKGIKPLHLQWYLPWKCPERHSTTI